MKSYHHRTSTALIVVPETSSRTQPKRKTQPASQNTPFLLRFFLILIVVAVCVSLILTYIWQRVYVTNLVTEIQELQTIEEQLRIENQTLKIKMIELSSRQRIEKIATEKLNMRYLDLNTELIVKEVDPEHVPLSPQQP